MSVNNRTFEKTKRFEESNIECLITLELHKILEVDMCKRDHFKSRDSKIINYLCLKTVQSLSELMENSGDGDAS